MLKSIYLNIYNAREYKILINALSHSKSTYTDKTHIYIYIYIEMYVSIII